MLKIIKNAEIYSPDYLGKKDILIGGEKILAIDNSIDINSSVAEIIDAKGKIITPGLIDQSGGAARARRGVRPA